MKSPDMIVTLCQCIANSLEGDPKEVLNFWPVRANCIWGVGERTRWSFIKLVGRYSSIVIWAGGKSKAVG